jgi:hypothetical protein
VVQAEERSEENTWKPQPDALLRLTVNTGRRPRHLRRIRSRSSMVHGSLRSLVNGGRRGRRDRPRQYGPWRIRQW